MWGDFIDPRQRVMRETCINENKLIAQAAMIAARSGNSIEEELIPRMDK